MGRARRRSSRHWSAWTPLPSFYPQLGAAALGVVLTSGCATTGRTKREEDMSILRTRPVAGCSSLGNVTGNGGGLGGAWLDNSTLQTYATNDALSQAADLGASHILITQTQFNKNQSGKADAATVTAEAFACQSEPRFATPGAAASTAPKIASVAPQPAQQSPLRKLEPNLWRAWHGSMQQPGFGSFDLDLSLSRFGASGACGAVEYPTLGCRGVLSECRAEADGSIVGKQRLSVVGKCVDGTSIRLQPKAGHLEASFALPDGRTVARGNLSERPSQHPLLASARRSLPRLAARSTPVIDEEVFESLPRFLPEVLPRGFVTDEPTATRVGADGRFRVERTYKDHTGALVMLAIVLVRSNYEGASATLTSLEKSPGKVQRIHGFPVLQRPAPAGRQLAFVVVSPRLQVEVTATGIQVDVLESLLGGLSLGYLAQVETHGQTAVAGLTESKEFEDPQGKKVRLTAGQSAFADRLISTDPGGKQGLESDGNLALGPPDYNGTRGYYTLGCRGTLSVAFDDNVLEDGPGQDLHIFEVGGFVEAMNVRISEDGTTWLDAGQVKGQPASVDIAGVARKGAQYRFVQVTDLGTECGNRQAGADIDAIGALHGEFVAQRKQVRRQHSKKRSSAAGPNGVDPRLVAEAVRRAEGVPLDVKVSGREWTLSESKGGYQVRSSGAAHGDLNGDGLRDTVVLTTRGDGTRQEHQLEVYTQREQGLGPLAQAVVGYDEPTPTAGSLRVQGNKVSFSMSGTTFAYELRHGSLIRLQP